MHSALFLFFQRCKSNSNRAYKAKWVPLGWKDGRIKHTSTNTSTPRLASLEKLRQLCLERSSEASHIVIMGSNYSKGEMIALGAVFSVVPMVATALRFWARSLTRASYGMEDYLIVLATVRIRIFFFFAETVLLTLKCYRSPHGPPVSLLSLVGCKASFGLGR